MIGDLKLLNLIGSHFLKLNIFKKKKKKTNKQTNLDDQRFEVVKLGSCFLKINILKKNKFG